MLFKLDRLIFYSANSFAFPLRVQQVVFVDDGGNDGWKILFQKEPQSCRVLSKVDGGPNLQALQIGRNAEHHGLRDMCYEIDNEPDTPVLAGCKVSTPEDVSNALKAVEEDPHCKDNVVEH